MRAPTTRKERRFAAVKKGETLQSARANDRGGWITYSGAKACLRGPSDRVVSYFSVVNRWGSELDPLGERLPVETIKSTYHAPERAPRVAIHRRTKRRLRRRHSREGRARHPDRSKARDAVSYAIKAGRLVRPPECEECHASPPLNRNKTSEIQFDHCFGYEPENWLRGRWLCRKCHREADSARGSYVRGK